MDILVQRMHWNLSKIRCKKKFTHAFIYPASNRFSLSGLRCSPVTPQNINLELPVNLDVKLDVFELFCLLFTQFKQEITSVHVMWLTEKLHTKILTGKTWLVKKNIVQKRFWVLKMKNCFFRWSFCWLVTPLPALNMNSTDTKPSSWGNGRKCCIT